ncbi:hypothetical protein [Priestia megaterium]|uniref:hypothetical protein n=1 Tax=Priestia megaterium TaxID=1404 RepID=UPI0013637C87|nr:hypothetical protein [Priestia megaterium]
MKTLFFQEQKLHRIEIVEDIVSYSAASLQAQRNRYPFQADVSKDGVIAQGTTGYIIKRWGRMYFSPYANQKGIERFTPPDQPYVLIPYKKVKNKYRIMLSFVIKAEK